jgi:hypothetical protein
MIYTETKFAYRHKPTNKWVCIISEFSIKDKWTPCIILLDEIAPDIFYSAQNIIEEDLLRSSMNGEKYAAQNFQEFELVEIEIEYRIKNDLKK